MEKESLFKVNDNVVKIKFESKGYFGLSATIYKLAVYTKDELVDTVREGIEDDLNSYTDELQDHSINELVDNRVADIMSCMFDYNDSIYSDTKDDDLIQVEFVSGGQTYDDLLDLLPDNKSIKELVSLWKKYHLKEDVNQTFINRTNELLDQLDSGEDEYDLAETIVNEYIKENY